MKCGESDVATVGYVTLKTWKDQAWKSVVILSLVQKTGTNFRFFYPTN